MEVVERQEEDIGRQYCMDVLKFTLKWYPAEKEDTYHLIFRGRSSLGMLGEAAAETGTENLECGVAMMPQLVGCNLRRH